MVITMVSGATYEVVATMRCIEEEDHSVRVRLMRSACIPRTEIKCQELFNHGYVYDVL